ncbi:MAG: RluA family pseudouridine synthase [Patescibacteria group bacterium]|nr:RluA family pseudouridine synthase [Patescibacteria group bacterium]
MSIAPRSRKRKIEVVYQDSFLLVLNKPAGWVTLRSATSKEVTLQDWLDANFGLETVDRSGIAHRLDRATRGLILVAKNNQVLNRLQEQFKRRKVGKVYWALVRGYLPGWGKIKAPVKKTGAGKWRFKVAPGGKQSITSYREIAIFKINGRQYTLLRVCPKTGRTHQIRVHLKYLGHPIFGDSFYGGKQEKDRPMFLVAKELRLFHPVSGKKIKFKIDLPKQLSKIIRQDDPGTKKTIG